MKWIVLGLVAVVLGVVAWITIATMRQERAAARRPPLRLHSDVLEAGLKGFPDCPGCQCYPEGRADCPDHLDCRARLAGGA
jgi:hypothetical protein